MSDINLNRLQLELPRISSLLFAGSALYVGFIDPQVRQVHTNQRDQLNHWSVMYNKSIVPMGTTAILSGLLGLNAYRLTREPLWIYGSVACFGILAWTAFGIMGINRELAADKESTRSGKEQGVADRLLQWVVRHRVRAFLALAAAGLFYAAQGKTSAYNLYLNLPLQRL